MPRRPRYCLPGAIYHVMLRGNNAQPIFHSDDERCRLCLFIQEGLERFGHSVIAFCFMTNHIHLAIQIDSDSLSSMMHKIALRYARFLNKKHQRTGHVFQGRFRSVLVESRSYLRALIRYIHLNPVQAGMCSRPEHYRWSSHRAYLLQDEYTWLSLEFGLENFGRDRMTEVKAFHDFVMAGMKVQEAVDFDIGGPRGILGSDAFINEVEKTEAAPTEQSRLDVDFETILSVVAQHYEVEPAALQAPGRKPKAVHVRAVTALLARRCESIRLQEVAAFFRRDRSVMSKAISKLETELVHSTALQEEIRSLLEKLPPKAVTASA